MDSKNTKLLLTDPEQEPNDKLLKEILTEQLYQTYYELQKTIAEIGLNYEWRFYRDGKSWLCKITYKKKTIAWLSVWENYIKTGFYFTEKNRSGVLALNIDDKIKTTFISACPIGKLIPLALEFDNKNILRDFRKIIEYKMIQK